MSKAALNLTVLLVGWRWMFETSCHRLCCRAPCRVKALWEPRPQRPVWDAHHSTCLMFWLLISWCERRRELISHVNVSRIARRSLLDTRKIHLQRNSPQELESFLASGNVKKLSSRLANISRERHGKCPCFILLMTPTIITWGPEQPVNCFPDY